MTSDHAPRPSSPAASSPGARDVIVVGAGHNGLVAATYLARAGRSVLVLEQAERVGGAVVSDELTRPGFVSDLFATNQNLFLGSPAFAELGPELERHGLRFATTAKPYSNVFPGGRSLRVYQDAARTRELLAAHDERDAAGWDELGALYERYAPLLFELYGSRLPSFGAARWSARALRTLRPSGVAELARLLTSSTRALGDRFFATPEAKAMAASWGMHLDFGPDVALGALFPFLELFTDMANGMSVVEGGASHLPDALAALVREAGGEIRTSSPVRRILVENGRASGVELESGERVYAREAVIANLTPGVLFGDVADRSRRAAPPEHSGSPAAGRRGLVPAEALPERFRRQIAGYAYGPATMMVHVALDRPVPWEAGGDLHEFGYVHIGPYVEDMARTYADALDGRLPASPLLVVGQTTAIDPTRAPEGKHLLWIQVRMLPTRIRADALEEIDARDWAQAKQPYAERVLAKLEAYAPGVRERILDYALLGPDDLERHNPNLVGGDSLGGSHHLDQNLLFRPRYRTPIDRLYLVGSATWPGAGVNAISGRLVAQLIQRPQLPQLAGAAAPRARRRCR